MKILLWALALVIPLITGCGATLPARQTPAPVSEVVLHQPQPLRYSVVPDVYVTPERVYPGEYISPLTGRKYLLCTCLDAKTSFRNCRGYIPRCSSLSYGSPARHPHDRRLTPRRHTPSSAVKKEYYLPKKGGHWSAQAPKVREGKRAQSATPKTSGKPKSDHPKAVGTKKGENALK